MSRLRSSAVSTPAFWLVTATHTDSAELPDLDINWQKFWNQPAHDVSVSANQVWTRKNVWDFRFPRATSMSKTLRVEGLRTTKRMEMTSTWLLDSLSGDFWTLLAHDLHLYFVRVKLLLETKHPLILPISIFYSSRFCQYKCDAMQLNGTLNMVHIQSVMTHMSTQNETPEKWRGRLFAHHAIPSRNNDTDLFNAICNVGKVNLNRQSLLSFNSTCLFNISSFPWVYGRNRGGRSVLVTGGLADGGLGWGA